MAYLSLTLLPLLDIMVPKKINLHKTEANGETDKQIKAKIEVRLRLNHTCLF